MEFDEEAVDPESAQRLVAEDELERGNTLRKISVLARQRQKSFDDDERKVPNSPRRSSDLSAQDAKLKRLFNKDIAAYDEVADFQRVVITEAGDTYSNESKQVCRMLSDASNMRDKYISKLGTDSLVHWEQAIQAQHQASPASPGSRLRRRKEPKYDPFTAGDPPAASNHVYRSVDGVFTWFETDEAGTPNEEPLQESVTQEEFYSDLHTLRTLMSSGPAKSIAFKRLQLLEARFQLHQLLNGDRELAAQKSVPHRDFYNIRKVDTHVHHSACMSQKHLLRFIKSKLKKSPGEIVTFRDGRYMTLAEVFESLNLTAYDLSVDTLDMHASDTFHRFDRFNLKYNPCGQSRLREIFLKTDNLIAGKYLADVTKEVLDDFEGSKYQLAEWRISIYGRKPTEWGKLAMWFYANRLASPHMRWLIQLPRLFFIYKRSGEVDTFQDLLANLFEPLFEVTRDPASNRPLHVFLQTVVGFDCVDDESRAEFHKGGPRPNFPPPGEWDRPVNPPYSYWCYYLYANIASLNALRAKKGLNTFQFRPHCGEAGDVDHLAAAYLCANQINHGIRLRKTPTLHYLYYLKQIGIAMSPLSNNKLFLDYHKNPFPSYFAAGLNVSLSTDDPLLLHYTKDALLEEYSVAAQVWRLSSTDKCEIARYSVLQSGFEHEFKAHFLGANYMLPGAQGNDIRQSNVPSIRLQYRQEQLEAEKAFIAAGLEQ